MRFKDGIDYAGTVEKVLDANHAFVQYDDGQSDDGSEFEKESSCARGVPSRGDAIDARRLRE